MRKFWCLLCVKAIIYLLLHNLHVTAPLRKMQTSRVKNSKILKIKNSKISGYCFY